MICTSRLGPIPRLGMERLEEICGITRIGQRIEHLVDRVECLSMPSVIDLKAADVETARAALEVFENICARLVFGGKPTALPLHIDGPGPWLKASVAGASGFGPSNRAQHLQRDTRFL